MGRKKVHVKRSGSDLAFDIISYLILGIVSLIAVYPLYFVLIASISSGLLQHHRRKYLCRPLKAYIFLSNLLFYLLVFYGILWYNVSREGFDDASNHNKIEKC